MEMLILLIIIGFAVYFYYNPQILKDVLLKIQNQAAIDQPIIQPITTNPPTTTIPPIHCIGEWSTWAPKCNSYNDNYHKCSDNYNINDKNITSRVYKIIQEKNINGQPCPYTNNQVETDYCNVATSKPIISVNKCSYNNSTKKPQCSSNDISDGFNNNCILLKKNAITPQPCIVTCPPNYIEMVYNTFETQKPIPFKQLQECYGFCNYNITSQKQIPNTTENPICNSTCLTIDKNIYNYIITYKPFINYETCPPNYTYDKLTNKCNY